jgi:hypothetical protein
MKRIILLSIASTFLIALLAQQLTMVSGGQSTFTILIPEKATVIEIQAAEEKETFLSDSLITVYNKIFDRAEKAVTGSAVDNTGN